MNIPCYVYVNDANNSGSLRQKKSYKRDYCADV